jgi:hypothetical protein
MQFLCDLNSNLTVPLFLLKTSTVDTSSLPIYTYQFPLAAEVPLAPVAFRNGKSHTFGATDSDWSENFGKQQMDIRRQLMSTLAVF